MYVEVSIPIALFKNFTYIVPSQLKNKIFLGQSVIIPFNNQKINGFITKINSKNQFKGKLLNISSINDNCFTISEELWKTINWLSKYYICPLGKVLNNTISYQHKKQYIVPIARYVSITSIGKQAISTLKYKLQLSLIHI